MIRSEWHCRCAFACWPFVERRQLGKANKLWNIYKPSFIFLSLYKMFMILLTEALSVMRQFIPLINI